MSKAKSHLKPDDKEQSKLFIKKAREIGADEDQSSSDKVMGLLHKMPPKPRAPRGRGKSK